MDMKAFSNYIKQYFQFQGYNCQSFYICNEVTVPAAGSVTETHRFDVGRIGYLKTVEVYQKTGLTSFSIDFRLDERQMPLQVIGGVVGTLELYDQDKIVLDEPFTHNNTFKVVISNPLGQPLILAYRVQGYYFR